MSYKFRNKKKIPKMTLFFDLYGIEIVIFDFHIASKVLYI